MTERHGSTGREDVDADGDEDKCPQSSGAGRRRGTPRHPDPVPARRDREWPRERRQQQTDDDKTDSDDHLLIIIVVEAGGKVADGPA